jgi:murein DD-endopeptidase MepM/ murein hydrolase activator NlpD
MKYPVNDYKDKWYIAQGFGEKTDYGYHEGVDLNLKTGGDSDLGQSLMAIANGRVTSVHEHTTTPTFGKHIHIKFNSPFGEKWVHYAHCQKILVPEGASVAEGQQVAELGKSGTKVAHCHFAIKNQPTGVDGIAKTQEDLAKWEDPIVFIEKCIEEEKRLKEIETEEEIIPDAKEEGQEREIGAYERFVDDLANDLKMKMERHNFAKLSGRIGELIITEKNYKKFVEDVAQGMGCAEKTEKAVREALIDLQAHISGIKSRKLREFGAWERVITGIIDLIPRRG